MPKRNTGGDEGRHSQGAPLLSMKIKYLAYIGPKDVKKVRAPKNVTVIFPKGVTVDISDTGIPDWRVKELIRSEVFQVRSSMDPLEVLEPETPAVEETPQHICACGKVCKTASGLKSHQKSCEACQ